MEPQVSRQQAQWYREQAKAYLKLAEAIENVLGIAVKGPYGEALAPKERVDMRSHFAEGGRVVHIAKRLNLTEGEVRAAILDSGGEYFVGKRGWIRPRGYIEPSDKKK